MPAAPTLLQIVPTLAGGGVARATLDAAQAVIAAGGSAIVASPGGAMVPDLLRLRATHLELPQAGHPLWRGLMAPRKLAASLRDARVSVIQARSPDTAWVTAALARRWGIKWIATLHTPFLAAAVAERYLERRQTGADAVIAVSDHVARDALQRFPMLQGRLETIRPGINLDRFDPAIVRADRVIKLASQLRVPDGCHLILCPARFDKDRGQKILIEAVKRLGRDDVFCLLLGSVGAPTPFERELERGIVAAELAGRMQIGPYVDDMPAAYMLADVVVSTGGARQGLVARWSRRRRWAALSWPRTAAVRSNRCCPALPDGWPRLATREHSRRPCTTHLRSAWNDVSKSRALPRNRYAAATAWPRPIIN